MKYYVNVEMKKHNNENILDKKIIYNHKKCEYEKKGWQSMRLQVSTDHAIRILQYLHERDRNNNDLHTAMDIANATGVTYPFFIKIANQLKKNGLLSSIQGRNGGYVLGRPAHEISLYDVFLAIEGELQIRSSLHESAQYAKHNPETCTLHIFLRNMQDEMIAKMTGKSIADLMPMPHEQRTEAIA